MKKIVFSLLLIITFIISSCSMSPDQMVTKFNGTIYEDMGNGIYETDGKPNINTNLIELPIYRVMENGLRKIEVEKDYLEYSWTLTDNSSNKSRKLSNISSVYIDASNLKLVQDGDYTLTLLVTSRSNILFQDTATIKVVKNIYK